MTRVTMAERPRRLRQSARVRQMVAETRLSPTDLIYPLFVRPGQGEARPIHSMPGQHQWSVDRLLGEVGRAIGAGVGAVMLFGIPATKDAQGSAIHDPHGVVPSAVRHLKDAYPDLVVMVDLCLCDYTDHGHCGILTPDGRVDNDATVDRLATAATLFAEAGADVVAPSDMMDGRVAAIRSALDGAGHMDTLVLSYAVKYASGFYAPFREAAENRPQFGDRRGYQMDVANAREALREARLDLAEGADLLMVKPALSSLDILARLAPIVDRPLAAYQVSGEYSQIMAAAERGWLDERTAALETLLAIRRAGASVILTYFAVKVAQWLSE
ncbi:MAG: porphobilinogen synthase [Thermaerobacter sp.]|nr:porphobilinogen synthase [Thermaerobacter sp.]